MIALLRKAGYDDPFYGPIEVPFHFARKPEVNLITDLEFELAEREYGRDFSFYD